MTPDAADLAAALRARAKAAASALDAWTWEDERLADRALGTLESALARANLETLAQAARHADCCVDRQELAQATERAEGFDRLATLTVEEVADVIRAHQPTDRWQLWSADAPAAAILALVRARVEGPRG